MSAVKALQQWCRVQVQGYRDVSITNMTTSFRDGLAFCALIHKHRPELINFDSLKKENVYENNKLAFGVAEKELGIPALLDAEDMVALQIPDRLSILTYVSQYYNYFHGRSPIGGMGGVKRPAEGPTEEPLGKKNPPVVSKVLPSSKPAGEISPPAPTSTSRPPPSPKPPRKAHQDVLGDKSNQTGTLSNKCVSCNKHVHLVQRHLVGGRLYHRSCAKSLAPVDKCPPLRELPSNTHQPTPRPRDPSKTSSDASSSSSSRLGPSWLTDKPSTPPSVSSSSPAASPPPHRPVSGLSPKPPTSQTTAGSTVTPRPTPAPRTSATAAKTLQSKIQFFQSDDTSQERETSTSSGTGTVQQAPAAQTGTITVKGGQKDLRSVEEKPKASGAAGGSGKGSESTSKAQAAAFISRKLTEENNNKPSWTNVVLKKTDKPSHVETPKKEAPKKETPKMEAPKMEAPKKEAPKMEAPKMEAPKMEAPKMEAPKKGTEEVRARVRLKADLSLLADLQNPNREESGPVPVPRRPQSRTPDPGATKPSSGSPNTSAAELESPADWRSKLKPVSKETKAAHPSPSSPKLSANGAGKWRTSEPVGPGQPWQSLPATPPAPKASLNGQEDQTRRDTEIKTSKKKPDYIPKEEILKELQQIDDSLNKLEKEGVQLEMRLRRCEEAGEDDSFMDELMVEWFNLIRNKQVAMRRESELVYIGKTQDLEEQQPSVEQELRRLMEKPEHLKSAWHRRREEELMKKLMEIVNDRNAIVEGLDEDRLREEEEDEQLNKLMKDFNVKKEKPKKKSPMSKLFGWGSKKEAP